MIEKVNPSHPDKVADRIAGALVDLAYTKDSNCKIAVEVLIGHGNCNIIIETNVKIELFEVKPIVKRIAGNVSVNLVVVKQDKHLSKNQSETVRCGDNGIFKGVPLTLEEDILSARAKMLYNKYPFDGKYILANGKFIICQSNAKTSDLKELYPNATINPLGDWTV